MEEFDRTHAAPAVAPRTSGCGPFALVVAGALIGGVIAAALTVGAVLLLVGVPVSSDAEPSVEPTTT
ncbi:MAG: hypothetical protein Q8M55_01925, partial [Actinomycetota bacterium]|nr:hypothetical protein [Actinomycetota bacterium]